MRSSGSSRPKRVFPAAVELGVHRQFADGGDAYQSKKYVGTTGAHTSRLVRFELHVARGETGTTLSLTAEGIEVVGLAADRGYFPAPNAEQTFRLGLLSTKQAVDGGFDLRFDDATCAVE